MSSGYNDLKLDEKSSYLTIISGPFGRYKFIRLPFKATPAGGMFLKITNNLFSGMPNVFIITDDILIADVDQQGKDHDETLDKLVQISRDRQT